MATCTTNEYDTFLKNDPEKKNDRKLNPLEKGQHPLIKVIQGVFTLHNLITLVQFLIESGHDCLIPYYMTSGCAFLTKNLFLLNTQ